MPKSKRPSPCERCETRPVAVKLTAVTASPTGDPNDGQVLDTQEVCRECATEAGFQVGKEKSSG